MSPETVASEGTAHGPVELVLVRHGESLGNVADRAAIAAKAHRLDVTDSDEDIALSEEGEAQADALGERVASLPEDERPTVVVSSPYRRARSTAERALAQHPIDVLLDERLRERELGIFDGITWYGIKADHPEESDRRDRVGKFYYRPPGGESWADVVLRIRSLLLELQARYPGERVWLFSHEAVIMAFRYVIEGLDAARVVALQKEEPIANCSMTRYVLTDGALTLVTRDDTSAVEEGGADVTHEEGAAREPDADAPDRAAGAS
ncbi:histidine phosphatase family protein [Propioniciclava soli]|uniref:Histidine phosphatase family protein n=1 Tax=Propioniciclava soli TaxID=2775081 RepID=A0ABZ3C8S5_9ACTN|nr:histidine phosphatase family protein [Propioniciclava soli]